METQNANNQSDADRVAQEQSLRIRDMRKKQQAEVDALNEKHDRDMKSLDQAYQVELTSHKDDYDRKLGNLQGSETSRLAAAAKTGDMNIKQAQETYRVQAEELAARGEKKLSALREQTAMGEENINRKKDKGNA